MKSSSTFRAVLTAASLWALTASHAAEGWTDYFARPGGSVTIDGTSTIHDWTVEGKLIGGKVQVGPNFPVGAKANSVAPGKVDGKVSVIIPARSLKSGKSAMDDVMLEAMKAQEHPRIEYSLTELTLKEKPGTADAPHVFEAKGSLTVSGVTKPITMPITMTAPDRKSLRFAGETKIKMTDFGIQPPAPKVAAGLITTGDEVTIKFDWLTAEKD